MAGLLAVWASAQSTPSAPLEAPAAAQQAATAQSGYVLKVTTRLVTLDVIATDSHGNPVRDLKPEDLQIFEEHKSQQKIEHFEYFEKLKTVAAPGGSPAAARSAPNIISNQLPLDRLKIPRPSC
jgi:hypothetical protein